MKTVVDASDAETSEQETIALAIKFNEQQDLGANVVREIQASLDVPTTGWWDEASVRAVIRFQREQGLESDGDVGAETLARMEQRWLDAGGLSPRARVDATPRGGASLADHLDAAVAAAERDWHGGASEDDPSSGGLLAAIFRDSGWSKFGVDRKADGKPWDWCGMAAVSWLKRAGLDPDHRRTFWATSNVHSFFTYSRRGTTHRTVKQVQAGGRWRLIEEYHAEQGSSRRWYDSDAVRTTDLARLDIRAGDVVLINHHGKTNGAHHIALVRTWDGAVMETIEGNASGFGPAGEKRREAVVVNRRDLTALAQRKKVFGIGRPSALDFVDLTCR